MGRIHSIQTLGTVDGPGVRFVAFLQGCPLRCGCCHNPDTWDMLGGTEYTAREIVDKAVRFKEYFGADGGITFSGGEPLLQWQELLRLSELVQTHLALETCGYADLEVFGKVIAKMDYIMLDLKLGDPSLHRKYTGVDNEKILENLNLLRKSGKPFLLRTPLIPGITDTPENLETIRNIVGEDSWEQLPYNTLTPVKYERLGKPYQL